MKKRLTVLDITICAAMIALHIVLELFLSIRIGEMIKISFSSLPLVVVGMLCGPVEGLTAGLVGSFLSQLLGPYGIMITTPIWILPPAIEAFAAGLIFKAFKRKTTIPAIAITVFIADLIFTICNWVGTYLAQVVILKADTIEGLIAVTPFRLIKWVIVSVIYSIILVPLTKVLLKSCPAGIRQARKNAQMEAAGVGTVDVPVAAAPEEENAEEAAEAVEEAAEAVSSEAEAAADAAAEASADAAAEAVEAAPPVQEAAETAADAVDAAAEAVEEATPEE